MQSGFYPVQTGFYPVQTGFYPVQAGFYPVQTGCIWYFFNQTDYNVNKRL